MKENLNEDILLVAKGNCGIPEYKEGKIFYKGTEEIMSKYAGSDNLYCTMGVEIGQVPAAEGYSRDFCTRGASAARGLKHTPPLVDARLHGRDTSHSNRRVHAR